MLFLLAASLAICQALRSKEKPLAAGLITFLGRLSHAYTVALDGTPVIYRAYGMAMTVIPMLFCSIQLLWKAVQTMLQ